MGRSRSEMTDEPVIMHGTTAFQNLSEEEKVLLASFEIFEEEVEEETL